MKLTSISEKVLLAVSIVLTLIGAYLIHLQRPSFWLDEVFSMRFSGDFKGHLPYFWTKETNMWLYYFLLLVWQQLGQSEFVIRSFSVLLAAASIIQVYSLGKSMEEDQAALFSLILLSVNSFFLRYAQEARSYMLFTFLSILSMHAFYVILKNPTDRRYKIIFIFSSIAMVYSHLFGCLIIFVQGILYIINPFKRISLLLMGGLFLSICLGISPLLFAAQSAHMVDWIRRPQFADLINIFTDYSGGNILLCGLTLGVLVHSLFNFIKKKKYAGDRGWNFIFLCGWSFLPVLISFSYSHISKPVFLDRYVLMCVPPFLFAVCMALGDIQRKYVSQFLFFILVIGSGMAFGSSLRQPENNEDWRTIVRSIVDRASGGEKIRITPDYNWIPFSYYYDRSGKDLGLSWRDFDPDAKYERFWLICQDRVYSDFDWAESKIKIYEQKNYRIVYKERIGTIYIAQFELRKA